MPGAPSEYESGYTEKARVHGSNYTEKLGYTGQGTQKKLRYMRTAPFEIVTVHRKATVHSHGTQKKLRYTVTVHANRSIRKKLRYKGTWEPLQHKSQ